MDNACQAITTRPSPPRLDALSQTDLEMIARVRDVLVARAIKPPSWRDVDPEKRRKFFDEVRGVLIEQGGDRSNINRRAQIITDALSGVGLLDQLLRDPYVEEIFVRKGEVAVEYDGAFHYLGKLADDRYFEDLSIHVADQGGATLRGDRPAVLIDLPNGERFTAIVPRLSTEGTAINIRTFGRRVKTLEEMEQTGTFRKKAFEMTGSLTDLADPSLLQRTAGLQNGPDRFHSRHQPAGNLLVRFFQSFGARLGIIQFLGKPGAVRIHALHLRIGIRIVLLVLQPGAGSMFQCLDRLAEACNHFFQCRLPGHGSPPIPESKRDHNALRGKD